MASFLSPLMLEPNPGAFVCSSLHYSMNLHPEKNKVPPCWAYLPISIFLCMLKMYVDAINFQYSPLLTLSCYILKKGNSKKTTRLNLRSNNHHSWPICLHAGITFPFSNFQWMLQYKEIYTFQFSILTLADPFVIHPEKGQLQKETKLHNF